MSSTLRETLSRELDLWFTYPSTTRIEVLDQSARCQVRGWQPREGRELRRTATPS
jgi:hypothetical protein